MITIKLPANGLTEKTRQCLELYHSKIMESGKNIGYTEDTFRLSLSKKSEKNRSICVPRFLEEEYLPFNDISELADDIPTSLYSKLYIPIRNFWRDCSSLKGIGLDDTLMAYNHAFGIVLHALNTVRRPNEYFERYIKHASCDDYLRKHTIMGIVYNALLKDSENMYIKLLLDDIRSILEKDAPEFLHIDFNLSTKEIEPAERVGEYPEEEAAASPDQMNETIPEEVSNVFSHHSPFVRDLVKTACNAVPETKTKSKYSGKSMAHLKFALEDKMWIKINIKEMAFVRALCAWGILSLDEEQKEALRNSMNKTNVNLKDKEMLQKFKQILEQKSR